MQTATSRSTKARKPAAAKLPYPNARKTIPAQLEWLAHYFRETSRAEALRKAWNKALESRRYDPAYADGLWHGAHTQEHEARQSLKHAIDAGVLLCAFAGTTVFELQGAV